MTPEQRKTWDADWKEKPKPAPVNETQICMLRDAAARQVLRGLAQAGVEIVKRARSPHGSDCNSDCHDGSRKAMNYCRCLRVMRLRVQNAGWEKGSTDWLLVFGDHQMGPTVRLQGPYPATTPLFYGGGFWCKVEV